jgi:hypothetical protein
MRFLSCFLLFFSLAVHALETDNYLAWNVEIKDSSKKINSYIKTSIIKTLLRLNDQANPASCLQVTREVASIFRARGVHDNPIEKWLLKNLIDEEFYPNTIYYVAESIFRDPYRFYIPSFGLAPNVRVNGVNLGMDKLTHWSSTGRHYFNLFVTQKQLGASDLQATQTAIHYGILDELTLHGLWPSGVFSFADLEANYQGLLFFKKLCYDQKDSYLKQNADQKWILVQTPKIEDYVNPDWDETFNTPYLEPENWQKVAPVINEKYCPSWSFKRTYQYEQKSYSSNYLDTLSKSSLMNVPSRKFQNPEKLCQN